MSLPPVLPLSPGEPESQPPCPQSSPFTSPLHSYFDQFDLPPSLPEIHNDDLFGDAALPDEQLLASIAELEAAELEAAKDNNDNDDDNNNNNNSNNSNLLSTQRLIRRETLSISQARRKKCREHKLNVIVNALRRTRWSFRDFLDAQVREDEEDGDDESLNVRVAYKRYSTRKVRQLVIKDAVKSFQARGLVLDGNIALDYTKEIDLLQQEPLFKVFTEKVNANSINFAVGAAAVQRVAPIQYRFLKRVMFNTRLNYASYSAKGVYRGLY